jgi:nucleoside-diphosphate-sugar epimerase
VKVLVVGAAGYLGRRLVARLRAGGVEVIAADIQSSPGLVNRVVDLRFPEQSFRLVHEVRPDAVVNLAYLLMEASVAQPHSAIQLNILGVNGLFDACVALGVPRVIYGSSVIVYGDQKDYGDVLIAEDTECRPRSLSGWMKRFNEAMAEHYNAIAASRFIGVRISSIHGRGKRGTFAPMDMILDAIGRTENLTLPWSSDYEMSFIHIDDVAEVFLHLVLAEAPKWTIYNTGGNTLTMGELAAIGAKVTGISIECAYPGVDLLQVSRVSDERLRSEFPIERLTPEEWMLQEVTERRRAMASESDTT